MESQIIEPKEEKVDCCSVCSLLARKFSQRTHAEKRELIIKRRPKPALEKRLIQRFQSSKMTRYFHITLYDQCEWLTGCETLNKLFCWPCLLFSTEKNVWNKTGYVDLANIRRVIKKHSETHKHLEAVIKEKLFVSKYTVDDPLKMSLRQHNELVERNRAMLQRLIDIVLFLAFSQSEYSASDFTDLISLISKYDGLLKNHLESIVCRGTFNEIRNRLISAINSVVFEKIKSEIKEARFIAVVVVRAISTNQLCFILRYLTADGVKERFEEITEVGGECFVDQTVCNIVQKYECADKVVSQSYDGVAVEGKHLRGVQTRIKHAFENALFIHCFAHRLESILSQSVAHINKECKIFFSVLSGLAAFFSKSCERTAALERIALTPVTGWNLQTVCEYKQPLIQMFENILENSHWDYDTLNSSKNYLEYLNDFNFNFLLNIFSDIFQLCDNLCNYLQNESNDFKSCVAKIEGLKNIINEKRSEFDRIWKKCTDEGTTSQEKRARIDETPYRSLFTEILDEIVEQISIRFGNFGDLYFTELCNFGDFRYNSFPEDALESLMHHYGRHFDTVALKPQLSVIYTTGDTATKKSATEMLHFLKETGLSKAFSEVVKLCELVLTLPTPRASDERSLSLLERTSGFVKKSVDPNLSVFFLEKDLVTEMSAHPRFYDDVIAEFAKLDSEIELHYK